MITKKLRKILDILNSKMKPLIVIPARGGSKGVPGKNIKLLNGRPLIYYTLDAASHVFDRNLIAVSTDSHVIAEKVIEYGLSIPFIRPSDLSTDFSSTHDVLLHAANHFIKRGYELDTIILLQPTSPFRTGLHIKQALSLYNDDVDLVVSVKETSSNPYYVLFEEDKAGFLKKSKVGNFARRQDCPKVWELNGAIYIIRYSVLLQSKLSEMTRVIKYEMDSFASHDIDSLFDWKVAELIASEYNNGYSS